MNPAFADYAPLVGHLRQVLGKMEVALGVIREAIVWTDQNGTVQWCNTAFDKMTGMPHLRILGARLMDILPLRQDGLPLAPSDHPLNQALKADSEVVGLFEYDRPEGCRIVEMTAARLRAGRQASAVLTLRDVTERQEAEEALRKSEERYRLLFECNPQPMWVFDAETLQFLAVNKAAVAHYGYPLERFLSMTIADIRPEEDVPALLKNISDSPKGIDNSGRWRHKRADETLIDVEIVSHELPFGGRRGKLVLVTDVSERNRLENQLRHAQRMEAIGQLAGGIAHDFNNLLTGIVGYSELLADDVGRETPTGQNVLEICELARKGTGLTRQLLAFGRRQVLQPTVFNLNTLVEGISKLLIRLLGTQIALRFSPADEQLNVRADSGQLEQVLVNLALNARDAMLRGGALTIATQGVMLAESRPGHAAHPQPYVQLSVSDTGSGMDKATQERIFEPFFTTKDKGRGTGLGLSVSYGIITQHGGRITVSSRPGEGTTFTVLLPRVDEQAA